MSQNAGSSGLTFREHKTKAGLQRENKTGGGRFQKRFHGKGDTGSAVWRVVGIPTGGARNWLRRVLHTEGLARTRQSSVPAGELRT